MDGHARTPVISPNASPKKFFTSHCAKGLALLIDKDGGGVHTEDEAMDKFIRHVFDLSPTTPHAILSSELGGRSYPVSLRNLHEFLQKKLNDIEKHVKETSRPTGYLGPKRVKIDRESAHGLCQFMSDDLEMESHSNFCSARVNACVYGGKWMFEVTLGTGGIQQIGWATVDCKFSNEHGVGDSADSYAYDGSRIKKWTNSRAAAYGQQWMPGDIIGVCIDLPLPAADGELVRDEETTGINDEAQIADNAKELDHQTDNEKREKEDDKAEEDEEVYTDDEDELVGTVSYYRNGEPLGIAFRNVRVGPGLAYFPTISLSHKERSLFNLGGKPFYFPIPGYQAIQQPPVSSRVEITDYLLECLERLICHSISSSLTSSSTTSPYSPSSSSSSSSSSSTAVSSSSLYQFILPQEDITILAARIFEHVADNLADDYIIASSFVPLLVRLLEEDRTTHEIGGKTSTIHYNGEKAIAKLIDLMAICMEPFEFVPCIDATIHHLTVKARCELPGGFQHLPEDPINSESTKGPFAKRTPSEYVISIKLLVNLLKSSHVMNAFLFHSQVNDLLEAMFTSKQPSMDDLGHVFRTVYWEGCTESGDTLSKENYEARLALLKGAVEEHDNFAIKLCSLFLGDDTPHVSIWRESIGRRVKQPRRRRISLTQNEERERRSPQGVFLNFLKYIANKNSAINRDPPPPDLSDTSTLCGLYFSLLGALEDYLAASDRVVKRFPVSFFCGNYLNQWDLTRFGGLIGHLRKNYPVQLNDIKKRQLTKRMNRTATTRLGAVERRSLNGKERITRRNTEENENVLADDDEMEDIIEGTDAPLEVLVLNYVITLFKYIMSAMFKAAAIQSQGRAQAIALLEEMNARIEKAKREGAADEAEHLQNARGVYLQDVIDSVRLTTWAQATLFSADKEQRIYHMVIYLVRLFNFISEEYPDVFSYIPQMYLETFVEAFHSLRRAEPPYELLQASNIGSMQEVVTFLLDHFTDPIIINPDTRDSLLQTLSVLLQYPKFVEDLLEHNATAQERLLPLMIAAFDNRNWATVATMFPRLLKGNGFAQSSKKDSNVADLRPSRFYAQLLRKLFEDDKANGTNTMSEFINKLFNNLNWTVSELEVAMRNLIQSTQNVFAYEDETQLLQRRCSIMFELSVALLRMMEVISLEIPELILDEELNIARICELLLYVISRTATGPSAAIFENVLSLDIMRAGRAAQMTRYTILAPVIGILLNLHKASTLDKQEEPKDAMYQSKHDAINVLLATEQFTMEALEYIAGLAWSEEMAGPRMAEDAQRLEEFMKEVRKRANEKKVEDSNPTPSDEGELCPICYADVINTTFLPCNHQSCRRCIQRHMLQNKTCFFCKAEITSLEQSTS